MTAPDDWSTFKLGDLFEFSNGINAGKSAYGSGTRFINILEVITKESLTEGDIPGRVSLPKSVLARYRVKTGDVLFNRTSETQDEVGLASVYVGDEPVVFGGFVLRGQAKTKRLESSYAKYGLRAPDVRRQIIARGQGGIRANVGQRDLKTVSVGLPERDEQKAIATALDDASALVQSLTLLIAKKRDIKVGMVQELLTGRTRLPGFTGEWRPTQVSRLGSFLKGRGIKRDEVRATGVPCIRYGELYTVFSDYTDHAVSFVDSAVAAGAQPLNPGDVLFAGSGETKAEIGMSVAYVGSQQAVAGGDTIILRGSGYDPVFLASLLNTPAIAAKKASAGQGDAVVHISSHALGALDVVLPLIDEQVAVARIIKDADAEVEALERRLESARATKTGMMQELLTGRTRLPVENAS